MSKNHPLTISSWTLGDQCKFEERVAEAAKINFETTQAVLKAVWPEIAAE